MPLHLLGKKSWNVYNHDNIDRVRRDEAAAAAREEAAEQLMQEQDAARRTAILRGEVPPALPSPSPETTADGSKKRTRDGPRDAGALERKRQRRLRGEDDTDRDMRLAREDAETAASARSILGQASKKGGDVPVTDHAGHIQLFAAPDEKAIRSSVKNVEAEAEKAKKKKEYEDQYTMRFSNAAGFKQGLEKPWYASSAGREVKSTDLVVVEQEGKDVWGNADPRRREREQTRASKNDPMAFMKQAQGQLKQAESDRGKWKAQREREIMEPRGSEKKRKRHRHREREGSRDSLEDFSLNATADDRLIKDRSDSRRHRHSQHERRRSRSPRQRQRSRHDQGRS